MSRRELIETLDVRKLAKNGLLPFTIERDMRIFDNFMRFSDCFEKGTKKKQEVIVEIARANKLAERTVRKIVSEMRAEVI